MNITDQTNGATFLNRVKVINAAEKIITSIVNERADYAVLAVEEKERLIAAYRRKIFSKLFLRNSSDADIWKNWMCRKDCSSTYKDYDDKSANGWSYQLSACKRILALATASTEETIVISDIGFDYIKEYY